MDDQKIRSTLQNIGLSELESLAYWLLVKYGPKTAVELSRLSKIARSKTYEVITRLRKKGLVMKVPAMPTKGVTQKFVALDPKKALFSKINDLKELSSALNNLYNNPVIPSFPKINMYTSKEAVKELLYDVSLNSKFFYVFFSNLSLKELISYSFDNILKTINKKKNYFILEDSEELKEFSKNIKNFSFTKTNNEMNYIIASDRVILDLYKTQHVVLEIVSNEAVKTFKDLYFAKLTTLN